MQDEWEMKLKQKTKQNVTKYKVNMTCYDEETRYRPMHDKGSKGVCKRWQCALHNQSIENAHMRQSVLNTQPMNQTWSCEETWETPKFGTHRSPNKWENS